MTGVFNGEAEEKPQYSSDVRAIIEITYCQPIKYSNESIDNQRNGEICDLFS